MQKTIYSAIILLVLQLVLIIAFNSGTTGLEVDVSGKFFDNFEQDKVTTIEIIDSDNNKLLLKKTDTGWIMPNDYSAPADTAVITGILDKLSVAQKGLAIATSSGAAKRFKTTKDDFERHVILKEGDTPVADFYLGTSAGFRYSHVRKTGEDAIFSLPISNYELSAKRSDWLDKNLAAIDQKKLTRIQLNQVVLEKSKEKWELTSPEHSATDPKAVQEFLDTASGITLQDIYDPDEAASFFTTGAVKELIFTLDDTSQITYSFAKKDDDYILKTSSSDLYFKATSWQLDNLLNTTTEKLSKTVTNDPAYAAQPIAEEKQDK